MHHRPTEYKFAARMVPLLMRTPLGIIVTVRCSLPYAAVDVLARTVG